MALLNEKEYSKDLFGSVYQRNFDVLKAGEAKESRFASLKDNKAIDPDISSDTLGKSVNGSNNGNSSKYSPARRTPTHTQSFDLSFDSPNPSLATINQKTNARQQQSQPIWFNNPKRRTAPGQAVKRQNYTDIDKESTFLTNSKPSNSKNHGFNHLSFGTRRNNNAQLSHINAFSDEFPPSKTISDLRRDENDGPLAINENLTDVGNTTVLSNNGQTGLNSKNTTPFLQRTVTSESILPETFWQKSGTKSPLETKFTSSITSSNVNNNNNNNNNNKSTIEPQQTDTESAVLVFGYPESIANYVIKHFAKFGNILEDFEVTRIDPLFSRKNSKTYPIYTGNGWVKLTFDNRASAIRALEESGTVFHGSIIGCVPYSKQAIENIASISINNSENIGESNISLTQTNNIQNDGMIDFSRNLKHKLKIKNDDKIFIKNDKKHEGLYSVRDSTTPSQQAGVISKVNNWLFGWDDL